MISKLEKEAQELVRHFDARQAALADKARETAKREADKLKLAEWRARVQARADEIMTARSYVGTCPPPVTIWGLFTREGRAANRARFAWEARYRQASRKA